MSLRRTCVAPPPTFHVKHPKDPAMTQPVTAAEFERQLLDLCARLHPNLALTNPLYSASLRTVVSHQACAIVALLDREADTARRHADLLEQEVQAAMRQPITAEAARRIMEELGCPTSPPGGDDDGR